MACSSSYNYVDNVNPNLICCVCRAPFLEPTVTTTCSHTFCRHCIVRSLESQPCCPVDRSPLTLEDLKPENLLLRNMVDELIVECPNRALGCTHTCQRQLLEAHLRDSCQYVQVPCPEQGCDQNVLRKALGKHTHDCTHRVLTCDGCGLSVKASDLETHYSECAAQDLTCSDCSESLRRADLVRHNITCPKRVVSCTQAENGCEWTGPRNLLESAHLSACPYNAIKGFFAISDAKMDNLREENSSLKLRLANAENSIQVLKRNIEIARRALGPWWRLTDTPGSSLQPVRPPPEPPIESVLLSGSMQYSSQPPREQNSQAQRFRAPNPLSPILSFSADSPTSSRADETSARNSPESPYSDPTFLASYFPVGESGTASTVTSLPPFHTTAASTNPHFDPVSRHMYPYSPPSHSFVPSSLRFAEISSSIQRTPTQSMSVAPVDLSSSLEGALSSLRNSIVSLSLSLDQLSRRQDIALTTENLRMNEEVGALRAIVHGLRMQVHSLITERNGHIWAPTTTTTQYLNQPPPSHPPLVISSTTSTTKL